MKSNWMVKDLNPNPNQPDVCGRGIALPGPLSEQRHKSNASADRKSATNVNYVLSIGFPDLKSKVS